MSLKTYLQVLLNKVIRKSVNNSFPDWDNQSYGSGNKAEFSYTAPSDGDFVAIVYIQRNASFNWKGITATNEVLLAHWSTDETGNTRKFVSTFRMRKGYTTFLNIYSGDLVSVEWRFYPTSP